MQHTGDSWKKKELPKIIKLVSHNGNTYHSHESDVLMVPTRIKFQTSNLYFINYAHKVIKDILFHSTHRSFALMMPSDRVWLHFQFYCTLFGSKTINHLKHYETISIEFLFISLLFVAKNHVGIIFACAKAFFYQILINSIDWIEMNTDIWNCVVFRCYTVQPYNDCI